MIIRKTYTSDDDYVIFKLTDLWMLENNAYLTGVVLECQDPVGEPCFKVGEEIAVGMCESVEVIEV